MRTREADDLLVEAAAILDENEGLSMYFLQRKITKPNFFENVALRIKAADV